jgi:hypothetical protein
VSVRLALAAALTVVLAAVPRAAAARSFEIEDFRVLLAVEPDASLWVKEEIAVRFRGAHRGVFRRIPLRARRPGVDHRLRIEDVRAADAADAPLKTEISSDDTSLTIKAWVPDARDTTRRVTFTYRVHRTVRGFEDHDELYWNATGTEWGVPIRRAEASIILPASVPDDGVRAAAYTGPFGAVGKEYEVRRSERVLSVETTRALRPGEGLTVVVVWPTGHVREPGWFRELTWLLGDWRAGALPLAALIGCLLVWWRTGRDPVHPHVVKPEYEPPSRLGAGEIGTIVDETVHGRDVVAALVELAVRGFIRIERVSGDFRLTALKPWAGDASVKPYETAILGQVFASGTPGEHHLLSELRRDDGAVIGPLRTRLYKDLTAAGYFFGSPETVRLAWRFVGGGIALAGGALLPPGIITLKTFVALAAAGIIVIAFARAMPRRTLRGALARRHILGFQEFLQRAEKDHLRRLAPDTLHRFLPHAIALGVEEAWIAGFAGLPVAAPSWYDSTDGFTVGGYGSEICALRDEVTSAWSTSPRGSGDSDGGSSGGSSGGGDGGGGGGTF